MIGGNLGPVAALAGWGWGSACFVFLLSHCLSLVDLSSWKEKIERDAASACLPLEDSEDEEEDDEGAAVLVEHQTDVAMEAGDPSQELYKDGILTIGCIGECAVCRNKAIQS